MTVKTFVEVPDKIDAATISVLQSIAAKHAGATVATSVLGDWRSTLTAARELGLTTHLICHNVSDITTDMLLICDRISVVSSRVAISIFEHAAKSCDYLAAISKGSAPVLFFRRAGKRVWIPSKNLIIR